MIISVCLPTYNREKELFKQLNIFFNQVKKINYNYEFIVSDNNSKDKTNNIIKKFKIKFSKLKNVKFVTYKHKSNVGFTKNLLKTLKLATGDYAMILADDDFPSRKFYKKIYEYLEKQRPKGILFIPLYRDHISKNLNNRSLYFKILTRLKEIFFEFSYINQRSGSMSGIIMRTKSIFLEKKFSGTNTLYPQIRISLNYYLKYGFHPINFNESINMTTQKGGIIDQVKDSMNRPKDYSVLERFEIVDFYKKKKLISKLSYFGALIEIYYWFYNLKFQVKYLYKNIKIFNQFNDAILPQIKDKFLFYIISFILIILPIKMSKNFYEMKKFILKEILSFYKYKIK